MSSNEESPMDQIPHEADPSEYPELANKVEGAGPQEDSVPEDTASPEETKVGEIDGEAGESVVGSLPQQQQLSVSVNDDEDAESGAALSTAVGPSAPASNTKVASSRATAPPSTVRSSATTTRATATKPGAKPTAAPTSTASAAKAAGARTAASTTSARPTTATSASRVPASTTAASSGAARPASARPTAAASSSVSRPATQRGSASSATPARTSTSATSASARTPNAPLSARTATATSAKPATTVSTSKTPSSNRPGTARGTSAASAKPTSGASSAATPAAATPAARTPADPTSINVAPSFATPRRTSMIGTSRPISSTDKEKSKQRARAAINAVRLIEEAAANNGGARDSSAASDSVTTQLQEALAAAADNTSSGGDESKGDLSQDPDFIQNLLTSLKRLAIDPVSGAQGTSEGLSQRMKDFLANTYDPSNPEATVGRVQQEGSSAPASVVAPSVEMKETAPANQHHRRRSSVNKQQSPRNPVHSRTKSGRLALPQVELPAPRQLAGSKVSQLVAQFERRAAELNAPTLADIAQEQRRQLEAYSARTQQLTENCERLTARAQDAEQRNQELERKYTVDKAELEKALQQSRALLEEATKECEAKSMDWQVCKAQVSAYQQQIAAMQAQIEQLQLQLRLSDKVRRHLHNQVLELKGNIRVFCRVRPLLASDGPQNTVATLGPVFTFPVTAAEGLGNLVLSPSNEDGKASTESKADDAVGAMIREAGLIERNTLIVRGPEEKSLDGTRVTSKRHTFTFDRVFTPEDGNATVFSEVAQLVQSAIDGYKICIFAYGQTGSGKTHTMEGDGIDTLTSLQIDTSNSDTINFPQGVGIISRTVHTIFAETQKLKKEQGWKHTCSIQILEVYMDTVYTLLPSGRNDAGEAVSPLDAAKAIQGGWEPYLVEAKSAAAMAAAASNGATNESPVTGCEPIVVGSAQEVFALLSVAAAMRKTRDTAMNARSSRSHVLFQLFVTGTHPKTGETRQGALTLVDLAGSERVKQSQVSGRSFEEATSINQSLSALGNVIAALGSGQSHVPFRDSKLTMLLQSSLGPGSKTLMLVNLSPAEAHASESLCSLRFAAKVNATHIGVAQRNVKIAQA